MTFLLKFVSNLLFLPLGLLQDCSPTWKALRGSSLSSSSQACETKYHRQREELMSNRKLNPQSSGGLRSKIRVPAWSGADEGTNSIKEGSTLTTQSPLRGPTTLGAGISASRGDRNAHSKGPATCSSSTVPLNYHLLRKIFLNHQRLIFS